MFAGPVFSNIIAGEFLDCVIWGVSPVLFWFVQPSLARWVNGGTNCYRRRLCGLLGLTLAKVTAYACLCYN